MNSKVSSKRMGIAAIGTSLVLSAAFLRFQAPIFRLVELYATPDHYLTIFGKRELQAAFFFGMALLLGTGIVLVQAQRASWRARLRNTFLTEPLCRTSLTRRAPGLCLLLSSLCGVVLIGSMRLMGRYPGAYAFLYAKDRGVVDLLVPVLMFASALLIGTAVWHLWKNPPIDEARSPISAAYLLLIGAMVFYAGEEISWGQDFFRWQTPALFSGNVEGQTNLHNYFNAYFDYAYIGLAAVLGLVLLSAWLEFRQQWLPFTRLLLPHPSMIGLAMLIAFVAVVWYHEQELLEELVAVFMLFYSLRIAVSFQAERLAVKVQAAPA